MSEIHVQQIKETTVPRPYTDITYLITSGIYATDTAQQLFDTLTSIYAEQGMELKELKPVEITLRKYLDDNTNSNQSGTESPEGIISG